MNIRFWSHRPAKLYTGPEEKADAGARLLDAKNPGWYRYVDTKTLRMFDGRQCVLGQVYGNFGHGLRQLRIAGDPEGYGFMPTGSASDYKLREAWTVVIETRRIDAGVDEVLAGSR